MISSREDATNEITVKVGIKYIMYTTNIVMKNNMNIDSKTVLRYDFRW